MFKAMENLQSPLLISCCQRLTGNQINSLSIIAVVQDNSYSILRELLAEGYDIVTWISADARVDETGKKVAPCSRCQAIQRSFEQVNMGGSIPPGFIPLGAFLGMSAKVAVNEDGTPKKDDDEWPIYEYTPEVQISHNAPIFNWSHVGCGCWLLVSKRKDTSDIKLVSRGS